ncbi:Pentatricopeptide repeat-containing protein [Arachis hypogaea]|nr:Pentatricopeptide repeat-containing protein [Arachis hypogaea]
MFSVMRSEEVEPNLVLWYRMLAWFSNVGWHVEAVELFKTVLNKGFFPDGSTVSCVLLALGNLEDGVAAKQGLGSDRFEVDHREVGSLNDFLNGLSRNGSIDTALEVFRKFKTPAIWCSLLGRFDPVWLLPIRSGLLG